MKKLLIANYDIPIGKFFNNIDKNALEVKKHVKEMNSFFKKFLSLKKKNPEMGVFVKDSHFNFKNIYHSENEENIYFKYGNIFYEDNSLLSRIINVESNTDYKVLIKDKKSEETFIIDCSSGSFNICFYKKDILKRNVTIFLHHDNKKLFETDINTFGYSRKIIKKSFNELNFESKSLYLKHIKKDLSKKSDYEIKFNKNKAGIDSFKIINGKIVELVLNNDVEEKLTKNLIDKLEKNPNDSFEELSIYIKEKQEFEYLSNDQTIQYPEFNKLLSEVKDIIKNKQHLFYRYHHKPFEIVDIISEDILGRPFDLHYRGDIRHKEKKHEGINIIEYEGFDYENVSYEKCNIENIKTIYKAITKELDKSGHDEINFID